MSLGPAHFFLMAASFLCAGLSLYAGAGCLGAHDPEAAPYLATPEASEHAGGLGTRFIRAGHHSMARFSFEHLLNAQTTHLVFEGVIEVVQAPRRGSHGASQSVYTPLTVRVVTLHRGDMPNNGRFRLRAFERPVVWPEFTGIQQVTAREPAPGAKVLVLADSPTAMRGHMSSAIRAHAIYEMDEFELRELTPRAWHGERAPMTPKERIETLLQSALKVKQASNATPKR